MPCPETKTFVLGVTSASGAFFARTLLHLIDCDPLVHLVVKVAGQRSLAPELGIVVTETCQLPQLVSGRLPKDAKEV